MGFSETTVTPYLFMIICYKDWHSAIPLNQSLYIRKMPGQFLKAVLLLTALAVGANAVIVAVGKRSSKSNHVRSIPCMFGIHHCCYSIQLVQVKCKDYHLTVRWRLM